MNLRKSPRTYFTKLILLSFLFVVSVPFDASADPDIKWYVQTRQSSNGISPYATSTEVTSGWSNTVNGSNSGVSGSIVYTGSVSATSLTSTMQSSASGTFPGAQRLLLYGDQVVSASIRAGMTASIAISLSSTSASESLTDGTGGAASGYYDGLSSNPGYSGTNASASVGPNGGTQSSTGGGSGTVINSGSCGASSTSYRSISLGRNTALTDAQTRFAGNHSAQSTITYTITIGNQAPVSVIDGPKVSGTLVANPATGATVTFNNNSYDPDDGTAPLTMICSALWTLHKPDGTTATGTTVSSYSATVNQAGTYTLDLKVTDNEGQFTTSSLSFDVGGERDCFPGTPKFKPRCEKNETKNETSIDPLCGNISFISKDPVPTRGYPLRNEITLNSRPYTISTQQWMGNSSFTYGMQVVSLVTGGGGVSDPHRYLIDGAGMRYDYGLSSSGSSPKTKGVFPTLTETVSGYTLSGAGALDEVYKAGNYTYEFDATGCLQTITDPSGNIQELTYDGSNRPITVTDLSTNKTLTFSYGGNGKVSTVTENGGAVYRELTYDGSDRITAITTKNASNITIRSVAITYDGSGRMSTITKDGDSATTATLSYQNGGHGYTVANISYPSGSPTMNYFATVPSGAAFRTNVVNNKGGTTSYDYDTDGNLIKVTEPIYNGGTSAVVHTYTYDSNRNMLTESNGTSTWTYTYNSSGKVLSVTDSLSRYTNYTYSGGVDLTQIADNNGTIASFGYNDPSFPHSVSDFTDSASNVWTIDRNAYGQILDIAPPSGSPTGSLTFTYDENSSSPSFGWLTSVTNGAGDVATVDSYTSLGDPTSITTNPASGVTRTVQMAYDATQRETTFTHDDGKTVETDYTGPNPTEVVDEAGTITDYTYCPECGKLTGVSGPLSWALAWVLDSDRDVTTFTDALSHNTTYTYGSARELKKTTYPDSTELQYTYDNFGRDKAYTAPSSSFSYSYTYDASSKVSGDGTFTYTYDTSGRLSTATGNNSVVTYAYGTDRQVSSVTYNFSGAGLTNNQVVEYTYNPDQTVNTVTWKNNTTTVASWTYGYDGAGRVTSIVNNFSETTTYSYDGEGKLLTQSNQNGTSRNYTYNNQRGWPTQIKYKSGATTTEQFDLTYDSSSNTVGNITGVSELSGATVAYTYDDLYRLTGETRTGTPSLSRTYGYDLAGNVTTINGSSYATYDSANKLSTISSKAVTHNTHGDLTTIAATSPLTFKQIDWNSKAKATRVYETGGNWVDYNYLYDGKRYWGKTNAASNKTYYIFSGDTLIGELVGGSPTVAYTWGADGLVSKRNLSTNTSSWYEFGPQGETRKLTNSSGASTDTYYYNAYGALLSSTGSTTNPYRYGGKYGYYTETFSGLILATQRWYSPQTMRWVSRDPIGYDGGVNLYEYVNGRALDYHDISGHIPVRNNSGSDLLYKPERGDFAGHNLAICPLGAICNMDGYYPPGSRAPVQIHDYMCAPTPEIDNNCKLNGFCLPFSHREVGPDFFRRWKNWADPYTGKNGWIPRTLK